MERVIYIELSFTEYSECPLLVYAAFRYCHCIGWCIGKCPLYRGVLYSECPLSEVPLYAEVE